MPGRTVLLLPNISMSEFATQLLALLDDPGYALLTPSPLAKDAIDLEKQITVISVLLGRGFASSAAYVTLRAKDDEGFLAKHTESIYARAGIAPYFLLGCVTPAKEGGHTRIFDGRRAASIIRNKYPALEASEIEYSSVAYREERATYPLCTGGVLRFRGRTASNKIVHLPRQYSESRFYNVVDSVLEQCVLVEHRWRRGDILVVNNKITLHDRTPFKGQRVLVRVRFDDPLNVSVTY